MTDVQLALGWDTGRARHADPATSVEAAAQVDVKGRCAETLTYLRREDAPVTPRQLSHRMLPEYRWAEPNCVSRRLLDLERKNLAVRVEEVPGALGRPNWTWVAA